MPYEWITPPDTPDAPVAELHLWPYRSLPKRGFVFFIGLTIALMAVPLLAVLGLVILWVLLPFMLVAIWALWAALKRSYRDGDLVEHLVLWPDRIEIARYNPRGPRQDWSANPYWVRITCHPTGGPVEDYLTLKGDGREVELGAFLTPEERRAIYQDLRGKLAGLR